MYNLLRYSNLFLDIESNSISSTAKIILGLYFLLIYLVSLVSKSSSYLS